MNTLINKYQLIKIKRILRKINKLSSTMKKMSDEELQYQTILFKQRLKQGETEDDILPEAFATMREANRRILGKYPYDVQVMGGIVLHQNNVAEMKTGEGKTLTATLPLYLNALSGKGAMLITPNAYLAKRDKEEMAPVFEFMGLSVGLGCSEDDNEENLSEDYLKKAYDSDILYYTNGGIGFDYLINNLASSKEQQFMREFHYAIIDEIDAVLLEAAQMPLIISGAPREQSNLYTMCNYFVLSLVEDVDYKLDDAKRNVWLTQEGINKSERFLQRESLFQFSNHEFIRHIILALRAHHLFTKNEEYVVDNDEIKLLDLENGRFIEGVKLQGGQHQAIEAKEQVKITPEMRAIATITFQNLFKLFPKLSGMTGTGKVAEKEFFNTYGMSVVQIPTNKPMIRIDHSDKAYMSVEEKQEAILNRIKKEYVKQRPLLIVAGNVDVSNEMSLLLLKEGIPHNLLNAVNAAKEAEIIAEAGRLGAVTLATSMAGRGTDIKLDEEVKALGGLLVLGMEQLPNKRTDLQLRGRAGRQGDPGESQFYICLEDKVIKNFASPKIQKLIDKKEKTGEFSKRFSYKKIRRIARRAQLLSDESGMQSRQALNELDDSIKMQRTIVYHQRNELMADANILNVILEAQQSVFKQFIETKPTVDDLDRFVLDMLTHKGIAIEKYERLKNYDDYVSFLQELYLQNINEKKLVFKIEKDFEKFLRLIALKAIDEMWIEQVDTLQQIKTIILGREYAQLNVTFEYHKEALKSFKKMQQGIKYHIVKNLSLSTVQFYKDGDFTVVFP